MAQYPHIKNTTLFILLFFFAQSFSRSLDNLGILEKHHVLNLYQMLKDFHDICVAHNLDYWIDGGTLIGACRHQGIVPWDDDADVCIDISNVSKLLSLRTFFTELNYELESTTFGYRIFSWNGDPIQGARCTFPFLDIFTTYHKKHKIKHKGHEISHLWGTRNNEPVYFLDKELYPLKLYQFGEFHLYGPNNPIPYLCALYGTDWFDTAYKTHTHAPDVNLKTITKEKISLTEADRIPAQPVGPIEENFTAYCNQHVPQNWDVSLYGFINFADGIGRIPIALIECIKNVTQPVFINTRGGRNQLNLKDISSETQQILTSHKNGTSKIALFCDVLQDGPSEQPNYYYLQIPKKTPLKIAFTRFETDSLPTTWIDILNNFFDMAIVPDPYVAQNYKNAGVAIPVFVLPTPLFLKEFLDKPLPKVLHSPYTFGYSAAFEKRKNHILLIRAFAKAFGNSNKVQLKLHGRYGSEIANQLIQECARLGLTNVIITCKDLKWQEYQEFMESLDCYVSPSKADSYSIPIREAMALGLSCIVADNSAQKTVCQTNLVKVIPCKGKTPAYFNHLKKTIGTLDEPIEDALVLLLKEAYLEGHSGVTKKQKKRRSWSKQYDINYLKKYIQTLINPCQVSLGDNNQITQDAIITNCPKLISIYQSLKN